MHLRLAQQSFRSTSDARRSRHQRCTRLRHSSIEPSDSATRYSMTTASEFWQEHEQRVEAAWRSVAFLLGLAALLLIALPCTDALRPMSDSMAQWFQRAGAPVTVFAFLAQNKASHLGDLLTPGSFGSPEIMALRSRYLSKQKCGLGFSTCLTIIGTIVWAYGDLLFIHVARLASAAA